MSNVNVCGVCGNENLVSVEILDVVVVGYCDCSEVLEGDVYTPEEPVCEEGGVEIEDEEFIYVYEEAEILAASVGCASCHQAACKGPNQNDYCLEYYPEENAAALNRDAVVEAPVAIELPVFGMVFSFFALLWAIGTGRNNNPKLVMAWYAFCAYLVVSYSAVIIWFLC